MINPTVYIVVEHEPDAYDYPYIIISVHATREGADAKVLDLQREEYGKPDNPEGIDPHGYDWHEADLWWEIEIEEVQE